MLPTSVFASGVLSPNSTAAPIAAMIPRSIFNFYPLVRRRSVGQICQPLGAERSRRQVACLTVSAIILTNTIVQWVIMSIRDNRMKPRKLLSKPAIQMDR